MFKAARVAAVLCCVLTMSAAPSTLSAVEGPAVADVIASYHKWRLITKEPVTVSLALAIQCSHAAQQQLDAEIKRVGPHANATVEIFMNDVAASDYATGAHTYRAGAVIVKRKIVFGSSSSKLNIDSELLEDGLGGMIKRAPGFDSAHGDWEFFYVESQLKPSSGRIGSCISCHDAAFKTDHVFGSWNSWHLNQ